MNRTLVFTGERGENKHLADQMECDVCGQQTFHIFQVVGQKHPHYVCAECATPFCPFGEDCKPPMPDPDERCPWCPNRMRHCRCSVEDIGE